MTNRRSDLHYKIFQRVKSHASKLEGETSQLLKKYRSNQKKYSKRPFIPSDQEELLSNIRKSNITYIGDFHTFDQNQRNLLRILKSTIDSSRQVLIGLEMVDYIYSDQINAYLNRHITELEFLESINYHDSWRFPWNHYKLIFDLAKKYNNIKVLGLNSRGDLKERDLFTASLLAEHIKADSECSVVVLFGEYHIAPNKIPSYTQKKLGDNKIKQVIVHQNLDEVYFKLKELKLEHSIVKFNDNEFCLTTSPPWVKYESQIYWFENLDNDPDFDLHEYLIEHGTKIFSDSSTDNFSELIKELVLSLNLNIDNSQLNDFNLKDHTQLDYIEEKLLQEYPKKLQVFFQKLIINNSSFHLPGTSLYYCSNYSLNRLSYLAGTFIFLRYLEKNLIDERKMLLSDNNNIFMYFTYNKLISYFVSKFINPQRKCNMYLDYKKELESHHTRVIKILDDYQSYTRYLKKLNMKTLFDISQNIGHILGEYLYIEYISRDNSNILSEFLEKIEFNEHYFIKMINNILKNQNYQQHQKRLF